MKAKTIAAIALAGWIMPGTVLAWPWSTDMMNQPSVKPQEPHDGKLFDFPKRSVPVTGKPTKVANRKQAEMLVNPVPPSAESLKTGKRLYTIYCAACHGLTGRAEAPVSSKIFASALTNDRVQSDLTEGWIWGTITFGSAIMPAYGIPGKGGGSNDLTPEERWHIVNYVRHGLVEKPGMAATNR